MKMIPKMRKNQLLAVVDLYNRMYQRKFSTQEVNGLLEALDYFYDVLINGEVGSNLSFSFEEPDVPSRFIFEMIDVLNKNPNDSIPSLKDKIYSRWTPYFDNMSSDLVLSFDEMVKW